MKIRNVGSGRFIRGWRNGEDNFATIVLRDRVAGMPSTTTVDVKDARIVQNDAAPVAHEFDIVPAIPLNVPQLFTTRNLTPSVASLDARTLQATRIIDGTAQVAFSCAKGTKVLSQPVSQATDVSVQSAGWVPGTLAAAATATVDGMLAGKMPSPATQAIWSTLGDNVSPTYVWNPNLWAAGVDLTCLSPWNDWDPFGGGHGTHWKGGTLVSPRHLICAAHIALTNGQTIHFVTAAGATVVRTIANGAPVAGTDIYVCVLNADVPTGVTFARVLDATVPSRMPSLSLGQTLYRVAVAKSSQFKTLTTYDLYRNQDGYFWYEEPLDAQRLAFYSPVIVGDSGAPAFMFLGSGPPVLLSTWTGRDLGNSLAYYITGVNAAMTALGGGYQLTTVNLSGFPTF